MKLIDVSLEFFGLLGVVFMYILHVWMDYAWLAVVAHFARVGINVIGAKWYRIVTAFFGAVLIFFGLTFLISVL